MEPPHLSIMSPQPDQRSLLHPIAAKAALSDDYTEAGCEDIHLKGMTALL